MACSSGLRTCACLVVAGPSIGGAVSFVDEGPTQHKPLVT